MATKKVRGISEGFRSRIFLIFPAAILILASGVALAQAKPQFKVSVDSGHFELGSQANVSIALFPIKLGLLPDRLGHLAKGFNNPKASYIACLTDTETVPPFLSGGADPATACGSDAALGKMIDVPIDALANGQSGTFTFSERVQLPTATQEQKKHIWIGASIVAGYPPDNVQNRMHSWLRLTHHCEGGGKGVTSKVTCLYWTDGAYAAYKAAPVVNQKATPPPH